MENFSRCIFCLLMSGDTRGKAGDNDQHGVGTTGKLKLGTMINMKWGLRNSIGGLSETS
jgi:hypothetical protein